MPKKILFISKSWAGASTRYRAQAFYPLLEKSGWQATHLELPSSLQDHIQLLKTAREHDVVVILRKTFPLVFLRLLKRAAKKIIFDFDDAIFVRSNGEHSRLRMRRFSNTMKDCHHAWAGNQYLAEATRKNSESVTVIPTSITPNKYLINPPKPSEYFDLVWIGSSSTKKYLDTALPTLEAIGKKFPQVRLKIIADFSLPTKHLQTVTIPWSSETEAHEIASSHVGISFLTDDPWTRGKCALKTLQYMAAGLPVIVSPVGAHHDVVVPNETGFFANSSDEWLYAIEKLSRNSELCKQLGNAGRERIINHFSVHATFEKMLRDLERLTS